MTKRLTPKQHRRAVAYIEQLQAEMRLGAWRIEVARTLERTEDNNAHVYIGDEAHWAILHLDRRFFKLDPEMQRHVLVHELCHLVVEPAWLAVDRNTRPRKGYMRNARPAFEVCVDDFATMLAPHLPLPPKALR